MISKIEYILEKLLPFFYLDEIEIEIKIKCGDRKKLDGKDLKNRIDHQLKKLDTQKHKKAYQSDYEENSNTIFYNVIYNKYVYHIKKKQNKSQLKFWN